MHSLGVLCFQAMSGLAPFDEQLKALMLKNLRAREFERRVNWILFPGSHAAALHLLLIDPNLPVDDAQMVQVHEHMHFVLGQWDWGEAIRRLLRSRPSVLQKEI